MFPVRVNVPGTREMQAERRLRALPPNDQDGRSTKARPGGRTSLGGARLWKTLVFSQVFRFPGATACKMPALRHFPCWQPPASLSPLPVLSVLLSQIHPPPSASAPLPLCASARGAPASHRNEAASAKGGGLCVGLFGRLRGGAEVGEEAAPGFGEVDERFDGGVEGAGGEVG